MGDADHEERQREADEDRKRLDHRDALRTGKIDAMARSYCSRLMVARLPALP